MLVSVVDDNLPLLLLLPDQVHSSSDLGESNFLLFNYKWRYNPLAGFEIETDFLLQLCHLVVCKHHGADAVQEVKVLFLLPYNYE